MVFKIDDINNKLEKMYIKHKKLIFTLNNLSNTRVALTNFCDSKLPRVAKCITTSAIDYVTGILKRVGIDITDYYSIADGYIYIKQIGKFRIHYDNIPNDIYKVYILQRDDKWLIEIVPARGEITGLDVGTAGRVFINDDGHIIQHLGINNELEAYLLFKDKKMLKIMNKKRDRLLHGLADYYTKRYGTIAIENLQTKDIDLKINKDLLKGKNLFNMDTSIKRQSWHKLFKILEESDEIDVIRVPPEYTSQICSECGNKDKKSRNKRKWRCKRCGYIDDSDINASKNIKDRGVTIMRGGDIDLEQYRKKKRKRG